MGAQAIITSIIGNVAGEVVTRKVGDKQVASFSVAVTDSKYDRTTGKYVDEETIWVRTSVWGPWADNAVQSLTKGTRVIVHGRLTQSRWTDKDGNQREGLEMSADDLGVSIRFRSATVNPAGARPAAVVADEPTVTVDDNDPGWAQEGW